MVKSNKGEETRPQEALATLLHGSTCPVGYKCLAADCVECLEIHMEKEVAGNGGG